MGAQIVIEFVDKSALLTELEDNMCKGGTFAAGASGVSPGDECEVVLVHPDSGERIALSARVVMVSAAGAGVAFFDFNAERRAALEKFAASSAPNAPVASKPAKNVHERLRGLNPTEQIKVARTGEVNERLILERIYGKAVWEPLLRNPRLTIPEVARLARMGNMPRPQLETIVANAAWMTAPPVRRALLSNRRLSDVLMTKVLRAMPKAELRLATKQSAYPPRVRDLALKLIRT
jgi:hypothetical protein